MATVAPHNLVTWRGTLGAKEMWQFSLHFKDAVGVANSTATANALLTAFGTQLAPICATFVKCEQVRISPIDGNGKLAGDPGLSDAAPVAGTVGSPLHPYQVALAVSLRSAKVSGAGSHGRFYLPGPALTIGVDGTIDSTRVILVRSAIGAFLKDVRSAMATYVGGTADPILVSRGRTDYQVVTRFAVGDVLDTMRSRRGALVENRTYIPLPS